MRPVLKPALRRLWRDDTTLQLGVDPARAVVLADVGATEARLLAALDGTLDLAGVRHSAEVLGVPRAAADRLLELLASADALDDGTAGSALTGLHPRDRDRLAPDLASLSLLHAGPGAADCVLRHRRGASVRVIGAGRIGTPTAALLAAAGVGRVAVTDPFACRAADVAPGGLSSDDVGLPRERAAMTVVHRSAPDVATKLKRGEAPTLTVVTGGAMTTNEREALMRTHRPHVIASVRETTGIIGPLVIPGESACSRCLDLTRTERDPGWSRIAAQLSGRRERSGDPCDVVLAALVAAQAAAQALVYLDHTFTGGHMPPTVNGTLELTLPSWQWRRRSWLRHPACGCGWEQQQTQ